MKKATLVSAVLATLMALSVMACGANNTRGTESTAAATSSESAEMDNLSDEEKRLLGQWYSKYFLSDDAKGEIDSDKVQVVYYADHTGTIKLGDGSLLRYFMEVLKAI